MTEHTDPLVLDAAAASALLAGAPWKRLAVLGDSIAAGVRDPAPGYRDLSWTDRIAEALDADVLNLGRRDLLAAEIRATQLAPALAFAPDLAIVTAGGNDMLRREFDEDGVRRELTALVAALRDAGADVVTIGLFDITAAGLGHARFRDVIAARTAALNAVAEQVAAEHGAWHVPHPPDHPAAGDPGIFSADGLHLNARGHAIAATTTLHALAAALPARG
ncbi:SGNH/GDSL hydrolase family protein [Actinomadura macrotermitis]|uniref:SGNH hydrolase-type esterase domain-containing protein n=1 Tax=Actinomadura macrotermitis TaxID=2585200 RepID=A0A7K0BN65_9ACTN|nr:SGNH/GDSL hydrolase family protein [Actinomadura macrotermitis]MQY02620.1 hypothetical protein [Actinomadura macrotermitis]